MYDLINDWSELDSFRNQGWEIDRYFDRETNEYEFNFSLVCNDFEIFKFTVKFAIRNGISSASVYIDTFNTWNTEEIAKGLEALQLIYNKAKQFDEYSVKSGYFLRLGRL